MMENFASFPQKSAYRLAILKKISMDVLARFLLARIELAFLKNLKFTKILLTKQSFLKYRCIDYVFTHPDLDPYSEICQIE